jgi:hypothetical protein
MKKNLKEHVDSFDLILETKLLSEIECASVARRLISKKENWENRSPEGNFFMSYGALTYLDAKQGVSLDPEYDRYRGINNCSYDDKKNYFNKLLIQDFYWLYDKIWFYYQEKFSKPVVFKKALPGFHIFQTPEQINSDVVRNSATIHVDLPQTSHEWGTQLIAASSFTIAIELPNCGAGLNIWKDDGIFEDINTVFYEQMSDKQKLIVSSSSEYYPYKLGYMYEQSGMLRHQITVGGIVLENERRITMQGHLVETDYKVIIYV